MATESERLSSRRSIPAFLSSFFRRFRARFAPKRGLTFLGGKNIDSNVPLWPRPRERPITPVRDPNSTRKRQKSVEQKSRFFTDIPLEVRRRIYDYALGEEIALLMIEGGKLRTKRGTGALHKMCALEMGLVEGEDKRTTITPKKERLRIEIALLCTCRQVYREAIESLYTSSTFVIADDVAGGSIPQTLLYLPYFIQPHRLRQICSLYIHWRIHTLFLTPFTLGKRYLAGYYPSNPWGPPGGYQVSEAWKESWKILAYMDRLQELYVRFECCDDEKERWLAMEPQLMEAVQGIMVKKIFVVMLPFVESDTRLAGGRSRCEFRPPFEQDSRDASDTEWVGSRG